MIPANHDRSLQFTPRNQVVQPQTKFVALAIPQPANPRWQSLKLHALLSQFNPSRQMLVLGEHFEYQPIGTRDVRRLSRKRRPPKRSFAFAEQRANVRRHKPREVISVLHALLKRECPNVVSIVERHRPKL